MEEIMTEATALSIIESMNLIDNFLFNEVMSDPKDGEVLCRIILESVLKRKVGRLTFTLQRFIPGISDIAHGVRLDAYINEESNSNDPANICVYDIEPDRKISKRTVLPRRCRYYSDLLDVQLLNTGTDYERLPELVIIFILDFDPFGENALYYEAGTVLKTHPEVDYDDGIRRIYLYTGGMLSEEAGAEEIRLQKLLRYIGSSTEANITDDATRKLDSIVKHAKHKKDIGVRYMKNWEMLNDARKEGREEGRKEGREEGREEGRKEERIKTEIERKRADIAEARVRELELLLATK